MLYSRPQTSALRAHVTKRAKRTSVYSRFVGFPTVMGPTGRVRKEGGETEVYIGTRVEPIV